jgi:CheY-like chemotaxis protein
MADSLAVGDAQQNLSILLIEGEPEVALVIRLALEDEGYHVVCAESGREALEQILANHPSAVILNLRLPDNSGWQLLRYLKSMPETKGVPVIVSSVVIDEVRDGEFQGAELVLEEPVDLGELMGAVNRVTGRTPVPEPRSRAG